MRILYQQAVSIGEIMNDSWYNRGVQGVDCVLDLVSQFRVTVDSQFALKE